MARGINNIYLCVFVMNRCVFGKDCNSTLSFKVVGNPFVGAAVSTVFDLFEKQKILDNVHEVTPYLEEKLDALVAKYDFLTARQLQGICEKLR